MFFDSNTSIYVGRKILCLLKIEIKFLVKTKNKSYMQIICIHIQFITGILVTHVLLYELINHIHFIIKFLFHFSFLYTAPPLILMKTKTVSRSGDNFSLSVDFISLTYVPEVHWFRIMEGQTGETVVNNEINRISYAIVKDNITFSIPSYMYVNS